MLQPNFWSLKHESTVEKGNFEHLFKIEANLKICRFFFTSLKAKPKIILGVAKPFSMFLPSLVGSGGQNDDFRPLTFTLGGRGMGCRDKYVTFLDASELWIASYPTGHTDSHTLGTYIWGEGAWGGSDIRSMSCIRPICKCRCPPLLVGLFLLNGRCSKLPTRRLISNSILYT
jgi:hypothetical protein